jgi:hypothetical protein
MMSQVFRVGSEYLHITKESPPAFKGVLFVCYRGLSPSTVTETVIPLSDIPDTSARVDPLTLPPDWLMALRLPTPAPAPPQRRREKALNRTQDQQAADDTREPGIDILFRQLANNPATSLLLAPITVLVIIMWTVVATVSWLAKKSGGRRAA